MAKHVRIRAIRKTEIDIYGCVLALLALARQLTPPPESATKRAVESPAPEGNDAPEADDA